MASNPADTYKEEALELLAEVENGLLALESEPDNEELVHDVFRCLHTIKGSGSMFGFSRIAAFTHDLESVFDEIRKGGLTVNKEIINAALKAYDHIKFLLNSDPGGEEGKEEEGEISAVLKGILAGSSRNEEEEDVDEGETQQLVSEDGLTKKSYRIKFFPNESIFMRGVNPISLLNDLRELGETLVFPYLSKVPKLEEMDPESCYAGWTVILTTSKGINPIRDVFIFVEDECELKIDLIDDESFLDSEETYKRIGDILVDRGDVKREDLESALQGRKRTGDVMKEGGLVGEENLAAALEEQQYIRSIRQKRKENTSTATIRVKNQKLDDLANLVSELVTLQARLQQHSKNNNTDSELASISEQFDRIITEVRDNTMSIRMVPIGELFNSFYRLVRDLSNELEKEVDLISFGAETELDKNLIEYLKDPIIHIIRNSIDHGIESPKEREAKGKNRKGSITLSAEHSGANVVIKIADDGAGLNTEGIRRKAIGKGLISADAEYSKEEIQSLIFNPGFSTTEKTTSVSGRGVGMDVVKNNVEKLRGQIEVSSKKDSGMVITMKLPLTLAIIDGLLVKINDEHFVINLSVVDECIELEDEAAKSGKQLAKVRGELVPYIDLRSLFEMEGEPSEIQEVVITKLDNQKIGFVVDKVVGQHQTVIKSLGRVFRSVAEISGATVLGNGTIALILDVNKIARKMIHEAEEKEREVIAAGVK